MAYVRRRSDRYYAVVYEELDPVTERNAASGIPPAPTAPTPSASPPSSAPLKPRRSTRCDR